MKRFIRSFTSFLKTVLLAKVEQVIFVDLPRDDKKSQMDFEKSYSRLLISKGYTNVRSFVDRERVELLFDTPTQDLPDLRELKLTKIASYCDIVIQQKSQYHHVQITITRCKSTILYRFNQLLSIYLALAKLSKADEK